MSDFDWPAPTADTLRAGLLATRKADDAERFARLLTATEPCPYDGAHEPGQPILCWSPGGPCEVPNAPGCETCGPCNQCEETS